MKEQLITSAGFSSTYERDRLNTLIELTVIEVLNTIADPMSTNACVSTTFDQGIASCIIDQAIESVSKKFDITTPSEIKYERIMGRKVSSL